VKHPDEAVLSEGPEGGFDILTPVPDNSEAAAGFQIPAKFNKKRRLEAPGSETQLDCHGSRS
jgi:hypothetical protein